MAGEAQIKLQAISICIHYSDYLECTLVNRKHFDRWIVVTVADDDATKQLCQKHSVECFTSQTLHSDGADFSPAWNKSRVINEALGALEPDGWAVILDADLLLPRQFRRRIEAIPLQSGCIYGLHGRRICRDRRSFEALRSCEPWEHALQRNTQALGYFNLFDLCSSPNRYPELPFFRGRLHDDDCFVEQFPRDAPRLIPMSALHAGPIEVNWHSRRASRYSLRNMSADRCENCDRSRPSA